MKKLQSFTLIELLIVISILGILVSMLLPAIMRVKQKAREVVCINNLKNTHVSLFFYAEDNKHQAPIPYDRYHPSYWTWPRRMVELGYIGDEAIVYCPECPRRSSWATLDGGGDLGKWGGLRFTYGLAGGDLTRDRHEVPLNMKKVDNPSNHILVIDTSHPVLQPENTQYYIFDAFHGAYLVHRLKAGTAFVDGSVSMMDQMGLFNTEPWGVMERQRFIYPLE